MQVPGLGTDPLEHTWGLCVFPFPGSSMPESVLHQDSIR